jgi:hypothetical protein
VSKGELKVRAMVDGLTSPPTLSFRAALPNFSKLHKFNLRWCVRVAVVGLVHVTDDAP